MDPKFGLFSLISRRRNAISKTLELGRKISCVLPFDHRIRIDVDHRLTTTPDPTIHLSIPKTGMKCEMISARVGKETVFLRVEDAFCSVLMDWWLSLI